VVEPVAPWPTVAVFPFSVSEAQAAPLAAKLMEEITAELGRYGIVRVVRIREESGGAPLAAYAAARFELRGLVLEDAGSPVFALRLEDRVSGQQVWADEFHAGLPDGGPASDIFDIGRVIAARIGAEHGVIARLLAGEYASRHFPPGEPFSPVARSQHFMFSRQAAALAPAIEALQEMTRRSPESEIAWTTLARLYLMNHSFELTALFTPVEMAIACANQSVLLEPASARTRCLMAAALLVKGESAAARRELDLALRFNSDTLAYREVIGWLLALTGDWEKGVPLMRSAQQRNPCCQPCVSHGLWADAMRRSDFEAAYASALEYREPNSFWRELMLASSLGQLGRFEEARSAAEDLQRTKPQMSRHGRRLIAHYIKDDGLRMIIIEGLRQAGINLL
jgi:tetratricopeptide (TPR) repeat protein